MPDTDVLKRNERTGRHILRKNENITDKFFVTEEFYCGRERFVGKLRQFDLMLSIILSFPYVRNIISNVDEVQDTTSLRECVLSMCNKFISWKKSEGGLPNFQATNMERLVKRISNCMKVKLPVLKYHDKKKKKDGTPPRRSSKHRSKKMETNIPSTHVISSKMQGREGLRPRKSSKKRIRPQRTEVEKEKRKRLDASNKK